MHEPKKIRNIVIIAHVDHGKTTLLDSVLKESSVFRTNEHVDERAMDSYDQEKERGITIFAKLTSVFFGDYKINIVDTPGHADFSGEVEKACGMAEGALLLVDAQEGPMPQTRFVLYKALQQGLKPVVVVNKIDKPNADPDRALNLTFDLFVELGATDEQLDFSYCYASGLAGFAVRDLKDAREGMRPLFDLIIENVPPPTGSLEQPFLMQTLNIAYDDFLGRQACGKILNGVVRKGELIARVFASGEVGMHKVTKIEGHLGLKKSELVEAGAGDIITLSGIPDLTMGDTLCSPQEIVSLPPIDISEPTVAIEISANSSPLVGKEGKSVTIAKIKDRLLYEKRANISLRIEELPGHEDMIQVAGRGELHLAVLLEAMRREGFELNISKPRVLLKTDESGETLEPFEVALLQVPENFSGAVIEELMRRKGEMRNLSTNEHGLTTLEFYIPSRGLMGYKSELMAMTKGTGMLCSSFSGYAPWKGAMPRKQKGVLISNGSGKVTGYALFSLQDRGTLFVSPGQDVYEGMVVGEHVRENDLVVNPIRPKPLTNVRASGSDEAIALTPPRAFTLEQALDFMDEKQYIELTPKSLRIRMQILDEGQRKRQKG